MNTWIMQQGFFGIVIGIIAIFLAWMTYSMRNAADQGEFCGTPEGMLIEGGCIISFIGGVLIIVGANL